MNTLELPSPAKLNLFLHILGRRDDGYHNLQTVFQLLDYGDTLIFEQEPMGELRLSCNRPELETTDNLVFQAARLLQPYAQNTPGVRAHIEKRLPAGGGLGGGSSNAATTLLGLNQLWECELSLEELAELGRQLGADVPVFVHGQSAWAEGVGERLDPLDLPTVWYLVLTPKCPVSTAFVFSQQELTRDTAAITVAAFFEQGGRNDCQPLVTKHFPEIQAVLDWLGKFGQAQMTGTGASVFAAFSSEATAQAVLAQSSWPGFVAKGVNQSPLHQSLPTR